MSKLLAFCMNNGYSNTSPRCIVLQKKKKKKEPSNNDTSRRLYFCFGEVGWLVGCFGGKHPFLTSGLKI